MISQRDDAINLALNNGAAAVEAIANLVVEFLKQSIGPIVTAVVAALGLKNILRKIQDAIAAAICKLEELAKKVLKALIEFLLTFVVGGGGQAAADKGAVPAAPADSLPCLPHRLPMVENRAKSNRPAETLAAVAASSLERYVF